MLKLSRLPSGEPEIFASVQGEGVTCGLPSVFVRLALCNLRCSWCDTRYTWDWTAYDPATFILALPPEDVAARVIQRATGPRNVVVTGGEPLLQQRALVPLAQTLRAHGLRTEVETNGTIIPAEGLARAVDQWNVSPKLANSGNAPAQQEVPETLAWFAREPGAYFKFVIVQPEDVQEARALVERYGVPADRVVLMPEGTEPAALAMRSGWLVQAAVRLGYRFSPRLHILLWGDERGR